MPAIQDSLKPHDLCRLVIAEPDSAQRAEVIAQMRSQITEEQRVPQSPQDSSYLVVAEMVLDFLEETLNSRDAKKVQ
jgi:hypothetical protein